MAVSLLTEPIYHLCFASETGAIYGTSNRLKLCLYEACGLYNFMGVMSKDAENGFRNPNHDAKNQFRRLWTTDSNNPQQSV